MPRCLLVCLRWFAVMRDFTDDLSFSDLPRPLSLCAALSAGGLILIAARRLP